MMFPQLAHLTDFALLFTRMLIAAIFLTSGWKHLRHPAQRSKDIEMSKGFTLFLGAAEAAGGLGVLFGVLTQIAAIGLILVMLGAIEKKITAWHTGFWGKTGTDGWHYDLMLVALNCVIAATGGGRFALLR
jgi:putative oxidoreductase